MLVVVVIVLAIVRLVVVIVVGSSHSSVSSTAAVERHSTAKISCTFSFYHGGSTNLDGYILAI